jgi:hypothetical protein
MAEREIMVHGKAVPVSVSQNGSAWVVSGSYMGQTFRIPAYSETAALLRWTQAARYRGGSELLKGENREHGDTES